MVEILGDLYYIDLNVLDKVLTLNTKDEYGTEKGSLKTVEVFNDSGSLQSRKVTRTEQINIKEIDGVKFEVIRNFITDLGDDSDEGDPIMGKNNLDKMSIRFKLAFNTLTAYGILKKIEEK